MNNVKRRNAMKSGLLVALLALGVSLSTADFCSAQTNYQFRTPASEIPPFVLPSDGINSGPNGEYDRDDNWFAAALLLRFVPEYDQGNGEKAFIENGGTAYVTTVVDEGRYAGQIVMGSATGTSGTLEVQNGGSVGAKKGLLTNGNVTVGSSAGIGTLRVLPGGSLTAEGSLAQGTNAANSIQFGGLTGATATFSAASAVLPAKVQVFPNAAVNITSGANFFSTSTYTSEITGNGLNGMIDVGGTATLGGKLTLNFNSYTPSVGHNWTVLEAAALDGKFSSITSNFTLGANQNFIASRPAVGGGQTGYNVKLAEVLILEVDRDSGIAHIKHPGSANVNLDGYFVGSTVGSLTGTGWNSVDDQNILGGDWIETAATATNIAELKPTNDGTILGGNVTNISLGSIYDASAGPFGQNNEDLVFGYESSDGTFFPGKVQYTGTKVNTLTLQVDPTGSGNAVIRNLSTDTVMIDGYDVLSADGRLSTTGWNSFDEQNAEGADTWLEISNSATQIGEVNQFAFTTIAPGAVLNLGPLYAGGTQDLDFRFLLMGQDVATKGLVSYVAFAPVAGDYNGNGIVDAADYTTWRDTLGSTTDLRANGDNTAGSAGKIDAADYVYWKARFGNTSGSGSGGIGGSPVPEPATWLLASLVGAVIGMIGRRERQK